MNLRVGDFIFDPDARELRQGERVRRLEPKASAVLSRLALAPSQTVKRAELLDAGWPNGDGSDEALTQAIAQVRRALSLPPRTPQYIQTVARAGYRLVVDVGPAPPAGDAPIPFLSKAVGASTIAARGTIWLAFAAAAFGPHGLRHWLLHHLH